MQQSSIPKIIIYHLEGRRSERIVWLCEELNLPYELRYQPQDLFASLEMIRAVEPNLPVAPLVSIDGKLMAESAAIMEFLVDRYANSQLKPSVDSEHYGSYLQWLHFAEGTLALQAITIVRASLMLQAVDAELPQAQDDSPFLTMPQVLAFCEQYLAQQPYFGGDSFTLADIMMVFSVDLVDTWDEWQIASLDNYPLLASWRERVKARPAYVRMLQAARPLGIPKLPAA